MTPLVTPSYHRSLGAPLLLGLALVDGDADVEARLHGPAYVPPQWVPMALYRWPPDAPRAIRPSTATNR